jgi:hypothetical protein
MPSTFKTLMVCSPMALVVAGFCAACSSDSTTGSTPVTTGDKDASVDADAAPEASGDDSAVDTATDAVADIPPDTAVSTAGNLAWAVRAGGSGADYPYAISALADGSTLVTGIYSGKPTFGAGESNETVLTSSGSYDIYVAKFDAKGALVWVKSAGGSGSDGGGGVSALPDGSSLVTGEYAGAAVFGKGEANETTLTSSAGVDVFVAKYGADGALAWVKSAGSSKDDFGYSISALSDGVSVVTGHFGDVATFGQGESNETALTAIGSTDVFVAKYNADGALVWARNAGGSGALFSFVTSAAADGSALIVGDFDSSATFGTGEANETSLNAAGARDMFVAKYATDGSLAWAKRAGGSGFAGAAAVSALSDGSSLAAGSFEGKATFGSGEANESGVTSKGAADIFVAKYGADGTLAWVKRAGGSAADSASGIVALPDGSSLVTGAFYGKATWGLGEVSEATLTPSGEADLFVAKYGADGSLVWVKRAGGAQTVSGFDISVLSDGSAFATGIFTGTATFGAGEPAETSLSSAGDKDIFVARFLP